MSVRFSCPHCLSALTVNSRFAGRRGRCPNCKTKLTVPELSIDKDLMDSGDEDDSERAVIEELSTTVRKLSKRSRRTETSVPVTSRSVANENLATAVAANVVAPAEPASPKDNVMFPRWVVYAQGALLGIVATTFFIFGMAVGNTTSGSSSSRILSDGKCVVSGSVYFDRDRERLADRGAVVLLLPVDKTPRERPEADGLCPTQFEPVRNPAIEMIRSLKGAIVRTDDDGKFETEVNSNQTYWLLVVSRNQSSPNDTIGKQTRAEMGTYFLPIESVLSDRAFMWSKIRVSGSQQKLESVTF